MAFRKAERRQAKLRLGIIGPSGAGKTYGALLVAQGLGGKIALIDTENGSGELYADMADYDVCQLTPDFTPQKYIAAIHEAENAGYGVIVIDSLTHAWNGQGGVLEMVDKRKGRGNDFTAWREPSREHNALVNAMLQSPCHVIATMRSRIAYDMERDEKTGKVKPVKIGLAPIQRDGMEYEFTVVFEIDQQRHMAEATKDRTSLFDGDIFKITTETGAKLKAWLETGVPAEAPQKQTLTEEQKAQRVLYAMLTSDAGLGLRKDECGAWIKTALGREVSGMGELQMSDLKTLIGTARERISAAA